MQGAERIIIQSVFEKDKYGLSISRTAQSLLLNHLKKKTLVITAYKDYVPWSIWDYIPLKNRDFKRIFN
jgi:hypothetical protein